MNVVRRWRFAPQHSESCGALSAVPLAVQADLGEGLAHGNLTARKGLGLQYSCKVRRLELIEPDEFLHLRILEPLDDLFESGGNDFLGIDCEWESLAELNPEAMRYQNVMNELP